MTSLRKLMFFISFSFSLFVIIPVQSSYGQCAMCTLNAENSTQDGNTQGKGLNNGVLFLLAMPFILGAGIGILWYKKFRVQNTEINKEY